jgi:hypothetical protein
MDEVLVLWRTERVWEQWDAVGKVVKVGRVSEWSE